MTTSRRRLAATSSAFAACVLWIACGDETERAPSRAPSVTAGGAGATVGGTGGTADGAGGAAAMGGAAGAGGEAGAVSDEVDTGTDAGASVDETAPLLVDQQPEDGDSNVWVRAPIVLTFSEALEADSVSEETLRLSTAEGELAAQRLLSADGERIVIELRELPTGPAVVRVELSDGITDLAGNPFAGTSFEFSLPLWQRLAAGSPGAAAQAPALALDAQERPIVAWQGAASDAGLMVARLEDDAWQLLGAPLVSQADQPTSHPALLVGAEGSLFAAWQEQGDTAEVHAAHFDGEEWMPLGDGTFMSEGDQEAEQPRWALGDDGAPVLAWLEDRALVHLRRWEGEAWHALTTPLDPGGEIAEFAFDLTGATPAVAVTVDANGGTDVVAWRWSDEDSQWLQAGPALDRDLERAADGPALAFDAEAQLNIAWREDDGGSHRLYAARFDAGASGWQLYGHAINVDPNADVQVAALSVTDTPSVAFIEPRGESHALYVARYEYPRWQVLGGSLTPPGSVVASRPALVSGSAGDPIVAWTTGAEDAGVELRRYNRSPVLPFGIDRRAPAPCSLPEDADPNFPTTLSDTGCYADVETQGVAEGAIPYDLNSPLWSDGALKRRFIVVPDGETLGHTANGAWQMPVGSLLIKEFWLERERGLPESAFIVETRFLVKRCEPGNCRAAWQGYSYQWDDEGTDGELLDNTSEAAFKDWALASGTHRHSYPGKDQCTRCHALAAGGTLGLQSMQLDRNFDYGDNVDNQLRTLWHIGLFGDDLEPLPTADQAPLPNPADPSYSAEQRARAYFHSNCSHCHRPDGDWPVIDFQYDAPLLAADDPSTNICNLIVPGNAAASRLYLKDATRLPDLPADFDGDPMPPLATLLPDTRQLAVTASWIDSMTTCP